MNETQGDRHSLLGRRALVVGGSGGIGRAVSLELGARGAHVIVHGGSSRERLDSTLENLERLGVRGEGFLLSFGDPHAGFAHLLDALPGLGDIDILCSALLPTMVARHWGRVLLFGGTRTDGIRNYSSNAAYAAAKTGLAVLIKSLAVEGAVHGVGAVLVCPGLVDTEYLSESGKLAFRSLAPGGRLIQPAEIAVTAVNLIAADPCIASGAVLSLDGGLSF